jgi:hypothetical protein
LTTPDEQPRTADEQRQTAPIELPDHQRPPSAHEAGPQSAPLPASQPGAASAHDARPADADAQGSVEPIAGDAVAAPEHSSVWSAMPGYAAAPTTDGDALADGATPSLAHTASPAPPQVTFVPMSVTIGDGFKFGCGFFLALVLAALVCFVLLAALFVLAGLFGLNPPLGR